MKLILKLLFILSFFFGALAWADNLDDTPILDPHALKDGVSGHENVSPCDNFYQFACGTWIDKTVIPSSKNAVYRQSAKHYDLVDTFFINTLKDQIKGKISYATPNTAAVTQVYKSCLLNQSQKGFSQKNEILKKLKKFAAAMNAGHLETVISELHLQQIDVFFNSYPVTRAAGEKVFILEWAPGGYGLYDIPRWQRVTAEDGPYQNYMTQVFSKLGWGDAEALTKARNALSIENLLKRSAEQAENVPDAVTGSASVLAKDYKNWNIVAYLQALNVSEKNDLSLTTPHFLREIDRIVAGSPRSALIDYVQWRYLNGILPLTGSEMRRLSFDFWDRSVIGIDKPASAEKQCLDAVVQDMGDALGELYVQTLQTEEILKATETIISETKSAFAAALIEAANGPQGWLSQGVLQVALAKINTVKQSLGSSEDWYDYSHYKFSPYRSMENFVQLKIDGSRRQLSRLNKRDDYRRMDRQPWIVDAYYEPTKNAFVLPFGILSPPSFDLSASDGANWGSLGGGTIGHELMHGYDDNGRAFDDRGDLREWWDPQSKANYEKRTQCIVDQTSTYAVMAGNEKLNLRGSQTVTEDAADQSGMSIGRRALEKIIRSRPLHPAPVWLGRYNERQQYWIAYAQAWCAKMKPEAIKNQIESGVHSPPEYRVNGVMINSADFARDFNCPVNAPMNPSNKCVLW